MQLLRHILVTFVGLQAIVQALELATGEDRVVIQDKRTSGKKVYETLDVPPVGDYKAVRLTIAASERVYIELGETYEESIKYLGKRYTVSIGGNGNTNGALGWIDGDHDWEWVEYSDEAVLGGIDNPKTFELDWSNEETLKLWSVDDMKLLIELPLIQEILIKDMIVQSRGSEGIWTITYVAQPLSTPFWFGTTKDSPNWTVVGPVGNHTVVRFWVAATGDASITLTPDTDFDQHLHHYTHLGGQRRGESYLTYGQKPVENYENGNLLPGHVLKMFELDWSDGENFKVWSIEGNDANVVMQMPLNKEYELNVLSVRTGWGSTGTWFIEYEDEPLANK